MLFQEAERKRLIQQGSNWCLEKLSQPRNLEKGTWLDLPITHLLDRLSQECFELHQAIRNHETGRGTIEDVRSEAADVANFAFMIADKCALSNPTKG